VTPSEPCPFILDRLEAELRNEKHDAKANNDLHRPYKPLTGKEKPFNSCTLNPAETLLNGRQQQELCNVLTRILNHDWMAQLVQLAFYFSQVHCNINLVSRAVSDSSFTVTCRRLIS
jgi:hypothetical protein